MNFVRLSDDVMLVDDAAETAPAGDTNEAQEVTENDSDNGLLHLEPSQLIMIIIQLQARLTRKKLILSPNLLKNIWLRKEMLLSLSSI